MVAGASGPRDPAAAPGLRRQRGPGPHSRAQVCRRCESRRRVGSVRGWSAAHAYAPHVDRPRGDGPRVGDHGRELRGDGGRGPARTHHTDLLDLDRHGLTDRGRRDPARSALHGDDVGGNGRRLRDPRVQRRLHEERPRLPALLRLPEPVRLLHAGPGDGVRLPAHVRGLGRGRAVQLPVDRILVQRP